MRCPQITRRAAAVGGDGAAVPDVPADAAAAAEPAAGGARVACALAAAPARIPRSGSGTRCSSRRVSGLPGVATAQDGPAPWQTNAVSWRMCRVSVACMTDAKLEDCGSC